MSKLMTKSERDGASTDFRNESWGEEPAGSPAMERAVARLRLLWTERRLFYRVCGYAVVASLILAFALPKRYIATARLMPPDSQSSSNLALMAALSSKGGGLTSMAGDLLGLKSTGAMFVGILRSRTVQERLVARFNLMNLYAESTAEGACETLSGRTQIIEDRKSGIITVAVADGDAQRAKDLADAYVEALNYLVATVSTSTARREREFIEERLKVVKGELDQAALEFSEFSSRNSTIDLKEQGRAMVEGAAMLQGQLIAAQSELEGLKQVYTDSNVRVRAAQARIDELRKQLNRLGGTASGVTDPVKPGDGNYPSIRQLPVLGVKYADLYRRAKIHETVFELLTQQYELAKVQEAKEIPTVKVLDAPRVPERKSFPPRLLILVMGTSLAFAFTAVWVLGKKRWNETDDADPRKQFAQELYASAQTQWVQLNSNGLGWSSVLRGIRFRREPAKEVEQHDSKTGS